MSDAEAARWQSCIQSVASNDPGMQAITRMMTTIYMCPFTNRAGCKSMVRAQKLPFTTANDMKAAVENAAKQVSSCVASSGRGLKAWGADMLAGTPVSADAIKLLCARTEVDVKAGYLSTEWEKASHLNLETKVWAVNAGLARTFLSVILTDMTGQPGPAWSADTPITKF